MFSLVSTIERARKGPTFTKRVLTVNTEGLDEYRALADELGVGTTRLFEVDNEVRLAEILSPLGLLVYDFGEVDAYMSDLARARGEFYIWRVLRSKDQRGGSRCFHGEHGAVCLCRAYSNPVPLPVLMLVKEISEKMPTAVFYVSDYAAPSPDPFLGVGFPLNKNIYVIEHWDEPNFGVKK